MFGIGDFARHGRVSVRMLRHYHAIGLLRPARVDHGREGVMPAQEVHVKHIPAMRVAELTGMADSFEPESIA